MPRPDSNAAGQLNPLIAAISSSLADADHALNNLRRDDATLHAIAAAGQVIVTTLTEGGRIFSCGNGGSMCDAMHFAEELTGRYRKDRRALPAMAIADAAHLTCAGNDYGYEEIFSRYLEAHGRSGDVLVALSTSGTSANILRAASSARSLRMKVIGLTGRPGSALAQQADVAVVTPGGEFADRVQELHIKVLHILIELVERSFFPENYR